MNIQNFAEWWRRQGCQIYRTKSSWWYTAEPHVLQAFPYHWCIEPSEKELRDLMVKNGILALRYSTPLEAKEGSASYHVVLYPPYNLETLRSQARNGVKKGLASCRVEIISFERLASEGWELQRDTLERQNRLGSMGQAEWEKICFTAVDLPGFEVWAAIVGEELAATIIVTRIDDMYYVPYAQSHRKFLNLHVNNALFYNASVEMLAREGVKGIFFSLHSLDAPESVNEFKFRMGLKAIPVRQRVVFHPLLAPFASDFAHRTAEKLLNRYPGNHIIAKTEGMLRFYRKGKLPLNVQEWPESVVEYRDKLFAAPTIK